MDGRLTAGAAGGKLAAIVSSGDGYSAIRDVVVVAQPSTAVSTMASVPVAAIAGRVFKLGSLAETARTFQGAAIAWDRLPACRVFMEY